MFPLSRTLKTLDRGLEGPGGGSIDWFFFLFFFRARWSLSPRLLPFLPPRTLARYIYIYHDQLVWGGSFAYPERTNLSPPSSELRDLSSWTRRIYIRLGLLYIYILLCFLAVALSGIPVCLVTIALVGGSTDQLYYVLSKEEQINEISGAVKKNKKPPPHHN